MEQWNKIIQTALIGTDKKPIAPNDFDEDLSAAFTKVQSNELIDTEEKFLQSAALVFNYRQSGTTPLQKTVDMAFAEEETRLYCSDFAKQVLKDILSSESNSLLKIWLTQCADNNQLVHPELLPTLFDIAIQQKQLRNLVEHCGGNRGRWLSKFNSAWQYAEPATDEELWQTGTLDQRKNTLGKIRNTDATKAREWLQQTWQQENAATKQAFLEELATNLSGEDVEWLESLSADKSQKVKDEALRLLKLIPESTIIKKYCEVLRASVLLKKEKALFGLTSKMVLHFNLIADIDEAVFKSGIEKLSSQKNISDEQYIFHQLIAQVPTSFWEDHLALSPKEIIEYFDKSDKGKALVDALALAVGKFKTNSWASYFMEREDKMYLDLVALLPTELKEKYTLKYFDREPATFINIILKEQKEWSLALTKKVLTFTAKNHYQYYRNFYNQHIYLIPIQAAGILESCSPTEEYAKNSWVTTSEYINKLLGIKQQINQAFNS